MAGRGELEGLLMSELYLMLAAFGPSFLFTAFKAFQQLNVVRDAYVLIIPTSLAMAVRQVFVIANIAQQGWSLIWTTKLATGRHGVSTRVRIAVLGRSAFESAVYPIVLIGCLTNLIFQEPIDTSCVCSRVITGEILESGQ